MKPIPLLKHSVFIKQLLYRIYYIAKPNRPRSAISLALKKSVDEGGAVCFYIGANDGLSGNHVNEFVVSGKLNAVFVEPVPFVFKRLSRVYGGRKNAQLVNCAVSEKDGTAQFFHLKNGTRPGYDQVGSFNRDQVEEKIPDYGGEVVAIEVKTLSFKSLLNQSKFGQPTILVVDAEGFDDQIVFQGLELIKPKVVVYEHMYLSQERQDKLNARLKQEGYVLDVVLGDTLAVRG
ncbi:MAG TPA: FkbM family methyltransferase [Verrucomicrobiae bacterium]|nr:FkbM family methyltransferase [Verrucomicrobiae bacterium]